MGLTEIRPVVNVDNIEKCIPFYRDILEFKIHTYSQADRWVILIKEDHCLIIQEIHGFVAHKSNAVCLFFDNLTDFASKLREKIPQLEDPKSSFMFLYGFCLKDPAGNQIWFAQSHL